MPIWTIAKKEARLLLRDPRAGFILLAMPVLFILVLGLSLGEGFGQKPDERLRVSLVDLDRGYVDPVYVARGVAAELMRLPIPGLPDAGAAAQTIAAFSLAEANRAIHFPQESWARV